MSSIHDFGPFDLHTQLLLIQDTLLKYAHTLFELRKDSSDPRETEHLVALLQVLNEKGPVHLEQMESLKDRKICLKTSKELLQIQVNFLLFDLFFLKSDIEARAPDLASMAKQHDSNLKSIFDKLKTQAREEDKKARGASGVEKEKASPKAKPNRRASAVGLRELPKTPATHTKTGSPKTA